MGGSRGGGRKRGRKSERRRGEVRRKEDNRWRKKEDKIGGKRRRSRLRMIYVWVSRETTNVYYVDLVHYPEVAHFRTLEKNQ